MVELREVEAKSEKGGSWREEEIGAAGLGEGGRWNPSPTGGDRKEKKSGEHLREATGRGQERLLGGVRMEW